MSEPIICKTEVTLWTPPRCNMSPHCPYCSSAFFLKEPDVRWDLQDWVVGMLRFSEDYGPLHIGVGAGEPLSSPEMIPFFSILSQHNFVRLVSNAIAPSSMLSLFAGNPNFVMGVSFHPHYWGTDEAGITSFSKKINELTGMGVHVQGASVVSYPPYIDKIEGWRKVFEESTGINMVSIPFFGVHDGKVYPDAYSSEEKDISSHSAKHAGYNSVNYYTGTKGKMCRTGMDYVMVHYSGRVTSCSPESYFLGNILTDRVVLLTEPKPCLSDGCNCVGMWKYIVEE